MTEILKYSSWKHKHHTVLSSFHDKTIVISYSGGKDSSVLLHFFQQASQDYDFSFEVHGVGFPCHVFTADETRRLSGYWKERGIDIVWHKNDGVDDLRLQQLVDIGESPCVLCSEVKKSALFSHFRKKGSDMSRIVIVLGYSLWDLVSASIELTLRTKLGNSPDGCFHGKNSAERLEEISQRFFPVLELQDGLTVFKPLITYNDPDINGVITRNAIPLGKEECRYKGFRPKRLLSEYYGTFGLNFDYNKVHDFAKSVLDSPGIDYFQNISTLSYVEKMI
ncbi:MAG: hypothetical protein V1793_10000 [Pseudomonadota bacterium]